MFSVGDMVVYGSIGICKVEAIGVPALSTVDPTKSYYTLDLIHKDGRIYAPVDTRTFMRPVISRDEALSLIRRMLTIDGTIYESQNMGLLREHYQALLLSHDCVDLIHVIKSIYVKRRELADHGKALGQVETHYMKRAEELLYDELSVALGVPRCEVKDYVEDAVASIERRATAAVEPGLLIADHDRLGG